MRKRFERYCLVPLVDVGKLFSGITFGIDFITPESKNNEHWIKE